MPRLRNDPRSWAKAYAQIQSVADREVLKILRASVKDVDRQLKAVLGRKGIGAKVRADQLRIIKRALLEEIAAIYGSVGNIIAAQQAAAAAAAIRLGGEMNSVLFGAVGQAQTAAAIEAGLIRGLSTTMDAAIMRVTHSQFPLSQRIYRSQAWINGVLDNMINSALARGLSAREFAKEVEKFFDPNVPGGTRYASMRLARTEINNAYHAATVAIMGDAPWIDAMKWNLSRSHPKADECDDAANEDVYGLGPGVYRPKDVPRKPRPHCFCVVTPIPEDEDEFITHLLGGQYDDYIHRTTGIL